MRRVIITSPQRRPTVTERKKFIMQRVHRISSVEKRPEHVLCFILTEVFLIYPAWHADFSSFTAMPSYRVR